MEQEPYKETLSEVKLLLGIVDSRQDELLNLLIRTATTQLRLRLYDKPLVIPLELQWIIPEVVIIRFNRIGSEYIKQNQEVDKTLTYYDWSDLFTPFMAYIDDYNKNDPDNQGNYRVGTIEAY